MSGLGDLAKGPVDNAKEITDHFFDKLLAYTKTVGAMLPAAAGKSLVIRISIADDEQKGG